MTYRTYSTYRNPLGFQQKGYYITPFYFCQPLEIIMKALYKKNFYCGPGGMKCPCCRPIHGTDKEGKQFLNRIFRRVGKIQVNKEIEF